MTRIATLIAALLLPGLALAAGSDSSTPPTPTETTTKCEGAQVWDEKTKTCITAQESRLDDDTLYGAARELAYAGRYADAQLVLAAMSDQSESRVLTYWGFTHRKAGRMDLGMEYYARALIADPDNILARSYMGQALLTQGKRAEAELQLQEIWTRGGAGSWAEASLSEALRTGRTVDY